MVFLKLCSVLIFYTYYSYSIDGNKCPTVFKYDFEKGDIVLREDTPSNNQYGGTYRAGMSITTMINVEQKLGIKFRDRDALFIVSSWHTDGFREDLKESDIQDNIYKKEKFSYERNEERKYVLSQDTPSVYYGSDEYFYRKGTPINKMHRLDRELFFDFGTEVLSRSVPGIHRSIYPKGMSVDGMKTMEQYLEVKLRNYY